MSCDYVLKLDWYCQLSGSGSNSLNLRKLPGHFSYGLGMRLAVPEEAIVAALVDGLVVRQVVVLVLLPP